MMGIFTAHHWTDAQGRPSGGVSYGTGFAISWQNGPLGSGADRKEPNGAFVETVTAAVIDRIEAYQRTEFACEENRLALESLRQALAHLDSRTKSRQRRGVEGTHQT